jgi:hypothetical protein
MPSPSQNTVEYAVLSAGGFRRGLSDAIVERSGVSVDELARDPKRLSAAIKSHRESTPGDFLPAHEYDKLSRQKNAPLLIYKESLKRRDKSSQLARFNESAVKRGARAMR